MTRSMGRGKHERVGVARDGTERMHTPPFSQRKGTVPGHRDTPPTLLGIDPIGRTRGGSFSPSGDDPIRSSRCRSIDISLRHIDISDPKVSDPKDPVLPRLETKKKINKKDEKKKRRHPPSPGEAAAVSGRVRIRTPDPRALHLFFFFEEGEKTRRIPQKNKKPRTRGILRERRQFHLVASTTEAHVDDSLFPFRKAKRKERNGS